MKLPKMALVGQTFDSQKIEDIPETVTREMATLNLNEKIKKEDTVAITAGSRGIVDIDVIIRTVVENLKKLGARPFIFPAMGSHGGATDQGST